MATSALFLIFSILSFVFQTILVQIVQSQQHFYKPLFLLVVAHGSYFVFLPVLFLYSKSRKNDKEFLWSQIRDVKSKLLLDSWTALWFRVSVLTVVFTAASLSWYVAVSKIPIGEISAIYNTSCFFTYVLSTVFLDEPFSWTKLTAVLCSVAGILVISLGGVVAESHTHYNDDAFVGYVSVTISSLCAAAYEVIYTRLMVPKKDPSLIFSLWVTGMIGVVTCLLGPILFPLFHWLEWETFELPPVESLPYIAVVALLGMLFNSLFLLSITFLGPVVAATGILVSIPLTSVVEWILLGSTNFGWNIAGGTLLIFGGFYLMQHGSVCLGRDLTIGTSAGQNSEQRSSNSIQDAESQPLLAADLE
ncbi:hypothetical protein HDV03_001986 [Kappamyces sp. JEL0829]|nr:hypothetical protein HDV03_001986 [Kappamyces sp. JEL0829]